LIRTAARVLLGYVALVEGGAAMVRHNERGAAYAAANERALKLNRKLIVIGDPDAGLHTRLMRAYGCGDVCVDLNGCPQCPVTVVADITKRIDGIDDDSAVVFVSCVLEYVGDLNAALAEILRVAGSRENVFIVAVQPWTLTARLYPSARWRAEQQTPGNVAMVPVTLADKVATSTILAALTAVAFWPSGKK
jgi:hypothetical protein